MEELKQREGDLNPSTFRLTPRQREGLKKVAALTGKSRNSLVRAALDQYLDKIEGELAA